MTWARTRRPALAVLFPALFLCGGCASPWERFYVPTGRWEGYAFAPVASAEVRDVEAERVANALQQELEQYGQSDVALEDEPDYVKRAREERFLRALRIPRRRGRSTILGIAQFYNLGHLDPRDGRLAKFAAGIGADYAVVASEYAGAVQQVTSYPVTTYGQSNATANVYGSGGYASGYATGSNTSTTWVPMTVTKHRYFYFAAFVRELRSGDPQSADEGIARQQVDAEP